MALAAWATGEGDAAVKLVLDFVGTGALPPLPPLDLVVPVPGASVPLNVPAVTVPASGPVGTPPLQTPSIGVPAVGGPVSYYVPGQRVPIQQAPVVLAPPREPGWMCVGPVLSLTFCTPGNPELATPAVDEEPGWEEQRGTVPLPTAGPVTLVPGHSQDGQRLSEGTPEQQIPGRTGTIGLDGVGVGVRTTGGATPPFCIVPYPTGGCAVQSGGAPYPHGLEVVAEPRPLLP